VAVSATAATWSDANQRHLVAAVDVVKARLTGYVGAEDAADVAAAERARDEAAREAPAPPALEILAEAFGLTPFERELLVTAAAAELDADVARLCAAAQGDPRRTRPSFALVQALCEDAHWSALTPGRPLRALRLVELEPGPLPSAPIAVAERVLHHLLGAGAVEERLQPWLLPLPPAGPLPASHALAADRLAALWSEPIPPVVQVTGPHEADRRQVLAAAVDRCGRPAWRVAVGEIPAAPVEREDWLRLVQREMLLDGTGLVVEVPTDPPPAVAEGLARLAVLAGLVAISTEHPVRLERAAERVDVPRPRPSEQRDLWRRYLGAAGLRKVESAIRAFDLSASDIAAAAASATEGEPLGERVWDACRRHSRPALDGLAQRVRSRATWDDLVLPGDQFDAVHTIAAHAPHRLAVADAFDAGARGSGLVALLHGPSGTGKTLAAEVIANDLGLDLFRVDLASVVSKWVGETEKHLRDLLDAADRGSAVLLFDEADALFGKRSEVRDSHDRFANIEIGYLLQRLESYRGVALLTTNMRTSLDSAFTRRIRYVVAFPHPGPELRERIWRRAFPTDVAVERLDYEQLARMDLTGGSIRNIAVHATLDAAVAGGPVTLEHLRRAALREYAKLERAPTQAEAVGLR
jgi:hypothetical protein